MKLVLKAFLYSFLIELYFYDLLGKNARARIAQAFYRNTISRLDDAHLRARAGKVTNTFNLLM